MKLGYLARGLPGHPVHPPLTYVVIGTWTFALSAAILDVTGANDENAARAAGLAFTVGLFAAALAGITGVIDWVRLPRGSAIWRTGLYHLILTSVATALFAAVSIGAEGALADGDVPAGWFVVILVASGVLAVGGWLGANLVYIHGYRVVAAAPEPAPAPDDVAVASPTDLPPPRA